MAALSKVSVCGHSLARVMGSNPAMDMDVCVLCLSCVLQVKVFALGPILVQRNPTKCVCGCVSLRVIKCNSNPLHLQ